MSEYVVELSRLASERCVLVGDDQNDFGRAYQIIVVLDENDVPRAYRNECEHIAVPLGLFADSIYVASSLLCATHGARYRLDDGYCYEGPCLGQSLGPLPIVIEGSQVRVLVDE